MELGFEDQVAFIAGSSRGIGFAIARAFLLEGAKVVLTGRDAQALEAAERVLIAEAEAERVYSISGDMTRVEEIEQAIEKTMGTFGRLDHVVPNVGSGRARGGWDLKREDWQTAMEGNLYGSTALVRSALPHLIAARDGTITFIASIAGCEAINAPVTYSAAKAAVLSAMKNLSRLVGADGIRVNAVTPGNVLFPGGSWERNLAERREFFENYINSEVPLKRFGRPEEIADAVVFLASKRSSFITGACLVVDGGQTRSI